MKNMKKLFALVLALALCFSLAIPAMAADGYTITLKAPLTGHQYGAFQIFSGALHENVLSDIKWGSGIDSTKLDALYAELATLELVTYDKDSKALAAAKIFTKAGEGDTRVNMSSASEVADAITKANWSANDTNLKTVATVLGKYLVANDNEAVKKSNVVAENAETVDGVNYEYTISGLAAGYYLVKDVKDLGDAENHFYTDYILHVVNNVVVSAKGNVPALDKTVYNSSLGFYAEYGDTYIGSTVRYKLLGSLPSYFAEYDNYWFKFEDTLSKGLDFVKIDKVYMIREGLDESIEIDVTALQGSDEGDMWNYTTEKNTETGETKLTVNFPELKGGKTFVGKDADGKDVNVTVRFSDKFVVEYTAKLNKDAVITDAGNPNTATLIYNNDPNDTGRGGKTPPDEPKVYSFGMQLVKVDENNIESTLPGAEFIMWLEIDNKVNYATFDSDGKFDGWTTDKSKATTLVTGADGTFTVTGLDAGAYRLTETKAPDGYNKLTHDINISINPSYDENDGSLKTLVYEVNGESGAVIDGSNTIKVTVTNKTGATLPSTGGTGTTVFYIAGGILVAAAVILLITKKRMGEEA